MAMRGVRRALQLPCSLWRPLGRAVVELAVARLRLRAAHKDHLLYSAVACRSPRAALTDDQLRLVEQVAFSVPRVAHRVPWRADCLVQALAGERWLRAYGIAAQIRIGVHKDGPAPLDAHAWLEAGGRVVTGGDIATFTPLGA